MNKENLYTFIQDPDSLANFPADDLKAVVDAYPYFHTARLLYTKYLNMMNSDQYNEELSTTAVLCTDRRKLFYLIYKENYHRLLVRPKGFPRNVKDRTDELLDSFLTSLGEHEIHETTGEESALNVVLSDYLSYLESVGEKVVTEQTEDQKLQHHDIIDAFIEKADSDKLFTPDDSLAEEHDQKPAYEEDDSEFLTETLAKIYIKQKKYAQALTIIKRLSLNFPKKSIYFADQIRFLEYLIMNEGFR
jgi:hypothetical protein